MRLVHLFILLLLVLCLCLVPPACACSGGGGESAAQENTGDDAPAVAFAPTVSATPAPDKSPAEDFGWLNRCSAAIISLATPLAVTDRVNPEGQAGSGSPASGGRASEAVSALPPQADLKTVATLTGGSGHWAVPVTIPDGNWELWYTADPFAGGDQDTPTATGSESDVFPALSVKIYDKASGEQMGEVQPPGGLDSVRWTLSGDPRPWSERFYYGGGRTLVFDVTARNVKSYTLEVRGTAG
jgi:hypothetical protein